ncbi:YceI family protein [Sphingobacterium sp. SYP-B4668]|uniref:YceI family protein n=1 Tax=Sphingobacterium sp. SYP-B4668 TaxID=2996035 RepID=UPI0022DE8F58|nr:YceI family protein [Sphingobacterium sp. SYP-B4668]
MAKTNWAIDPSHSHIGFKVKYMIFTNVSGMFKDFQAVIESVDDQIETLKVSFTANVSSIDTNSIDRDDHLRSSDFFDVVRYPIISFESTNIIQNSHNRFDMLGKFTIRDITRSIALEVEYNELMKDPWGKTIVGLSLSGKVNRSDYGLDWNTSLETGGLLVGEEIKLFSDIQLIRQ